MGGYRRGCGSRSVGTDVSEFTLQGKRIAVKDGVCIFEDGTLAGTHLDMASAVRKTVELGRKLAITGTPTLFFADGERVPGAVPLAQIEKKLEQASAK